MDHIGEVTLGHRNGKGFDLTGPERLNTSPHRRQWEAADPIKERSHCQRAHFATAYTTLRVVLTAAWAV